MENRVKIIILLLVICLCAGAGFSYWYFNRSKISTEEIVTATEAIEILQNKFSELREYPSDQLPPKSIKTEKTDDGWYIAFVQEGSGVPIIDARCFLVKNSEDITEKEYVKTNDYVNGDFSAKECKVVSAVVGGDRDEHGCIGSAGYSWCEAKQKCLRVWEESCQSDSGDSLCGRENCHGLDIVCGSNTPDVCTEIYEIGDKCLPYAECGIKNDQCQPIENSQFSQCKSCVQKCLDENPDDNIKLFECENNC